MNKCDNGRLRIVPRFILRYFNFSQNIQWSVESTHIADLQQVRFAWAVSSAAVSWGDAVRTVKVSLILWYQGIHSTWKFAGDLHKFHISFDNSGNYRYLIRHFYFDIDWTIAISQLGKNCRQVQLFGCTSVLAEQMFGAGRRNAQQGRE